MLFVAYLLSSLPNPESFQMFGGHMLQGNTGPSLVPGMNLGSFQLVLVFLFPLRDAVLTREV